MATEKRLIDANELVKKSTQLLFPSNMEPCGHIPGCVAAVCVSEIYATPTVDAVEVVHGQWRKVYTCHGEQAWGYECDQCKADNARASYYCPNCGAKMDGGNDDG